MSAINKIALADDVPPHDLQYELCSLASILADPKRCQLELNNLREEYFYDGRCRAAWKEIHKMSLEGDPIDPRLLADRLKSHPLFPEGDSNSWVWCTLYDDRNVDVPSSGYMRLRQLDKFYRQRLWRQVAQLLQADSNADTSELMAELNKPVRTFTEDYAEKSSTSYTGMLAEKRYHEAKALKDSGRRYAGIDCGFDPISQKLNGLLPGELTVLAARPGVGKSTLAMQISLAAAQKEGAKVGYFTLEMTAEQIAIRLVSILAGVSSQAVLAGELSAAEERLYAEASAAYKRLPIYLFDSIRTTQDMRAIVSQWPQIDLWIVDHLHRIAGTEPEERHRIGNAAENLSNLAVDINKHVLLLSQLNRDCESRTDKEPQLSDLRASGTIEEVAANVLMIYRPGFYEDIRGRHRQNPAALEEVERQATILVEKCRFGVPGPVSLAWVPEHGIFANTAPKYLQAQERYVAWNPIDEEDR